MFFIPRICAVLTSMHIIITQKSPCFNPQLRKLENPHIMQSASNKLSWKSTHNPASPAFNLKFIIHTHSNPICFQHEVQNPHTIQFSSTQNMVFKIYTYSHLSNMLCSNFPIGTYLSIVIYHYTVNNAFTKQYNCQFFPFTEDKKFTDDADTIHKTELFHLFCARNIKFKFNISYLHALKYVPNARSPFMYLQYM